MIKLIKQIFKFGIVGVICFFADFLIMLALTDIFHIHYLISNATSFTLSTVLNYLLSMRFVFKSKENVNKTVEFIVFVVLSIIGLGLNELLMYICVDSLGIIKWISKIAVTAIVMVYNFITRKLFLEGKSR